MKKKIICILFCTLLIATAVPAVCSTTLALKSFNRYEQQTKHQFFDTTPVPLPPPKGWMKTFGGTGSDAGISVQQTTDGGYIITGATRSFGAGDDDVWLIKTNSNGKKLWGKTFGGTNSDVGFSGQQTSDGGYIITGCFNLFYNDTYNDWTCDAGLIKTDANGDKLWDKTFEGTATSAEGRYVQQTTDGGYIIVGNIFGYGDNDVWLNEVWLIKTDCNGDMVWDKTFRGTGNYNFSFSGQQTADGGYIIIGETGSYITHEIYVWLIKTDSNGNELWNKTFGGTGSVDGYSVQQTTDGGYIITGQKGGDVWLIKTDSNGDKIWDNTFGRTYDDVGCSVQQTTDGGYIITGITGNWGGDIPGDAWLIKTDDVGNKVWDKIFGGWDRDAGISVQQTTDGGYIITGSTRSFGAGDDDVWLIKTDNLGRPRNKAIDNPILRFFEHHPFLYKMFQMLFKQLQV